MHGRIKLAAGVAAFALLATGGAAAAGGGEATHDDALKFRAWLTGFEEVPPISTQARGRFHATLAGDTIEWRLEYDGIEGGPVQQAHIHFGQRAVNGGVSAFLCSNLPSAPSGVQPCPEPPASISGTIGPDQVVGPEDQGIAPGEFDELVRAMAFGVTYANVHSEQYPAGEIRGQIKAHK